MTQVTFVDTMPVAPGQVPRGVSPPLTDGLSGDEFASALQQALAAIAGGQDLQAVFRLPQFDGGPNSRAAALRAVALENLAAGTMPQGVLDLSVLRSPAAAQAANGAADTGSDKAPGQSKKLQGLLEYLAAIIAPLVLNMQQPPGAAPVSVKDDASPPGSAAGMSDASGATAAGAPVTAVIPAMGAVPDNATEQPSGTGGAVPDEPVAGPGGLQEVFEKLTAKFEDALGEAVKGLLSKPGGEEKPQMQTALEPQTNAKAGDGTGQTGDSPEGGETGSDANIAAKGRSLPQAQGAFAVEVAEGGRPGTAVSENASAGRRAHRPGAAGPAPVTQAPLDAAQSAPGAAPPAAEAVPNAAIAPVGEYAAAEVAQADTAGQRNGEAPDGVQAAPGDASGRLLESGPARSHEVARADQERLIARISGAITQAERSGRSTVRVRLYPPELGTVRIEVSSLRGAVTARIEVSSAATQGVLQSNMAALRADLRQAGIDVRDVQVQYREQSLASGPEDRSARREADDRQPQYARRHHAEEASDRAEAPGAYVESSRAQGLNVFV